MRRIEESREILYVIRAVDVMMSSGVGLEAAMHTIGVVLAEVVGFAFNHCVAVLIEDAYKAGALFSLPLFVVGTVVGTVVGAEAVVCAAEDMAASVAAGAESASARVLIS